MSAITLDGMSAAELEKLVERAKESLAAAKQREEDATTWTDEMPPGEPVKIDGTWAAWGEDKRDQGKYVFYRDKDGEVRYMWLYTAGAPREFRGHPIIWNYIRPGSADGMNTPSCLAAIARLSVIGQ